MVKEGRKEVPEGVRNVEEETVATVDIQNIGGGCGNTSSNAASTSERSGGEGSSGPSGGPNSGLNAAWGQPPPHPQGTPSNEFNQWTPGWTGANTRSCMGWGKKKGTPPACMGIGPQR